MFLAGAALFVIAALLLLTSERLVAQLLAPALGVPAGLTVGSIMLSENEWFIVAYALLVVASLVVLALRGMRLFQDWSRAFRNYPAA